jgi:hypothetical protein
MKNKSLFYYLKSFVFTIVASSLLVACTENFQDDVNPASSSVF